MLTSETPGEEASEAGGTARAGKGEVAQKEARSEAALRAYGEPDADADTRPVEGRALDRWADTEPPLGFRVAGGPQQRELGETASGRAATGAGDRFKRARGRRRA